MQKTGAEFPPTHWTLIVASSGPQREVALTQLYRIYWVPLCAQARRFGAAVDEVEDLVQEFFVSLFDSGALNRVDPQVGRFRGYLIAALRHRLSDHRARGQAKKRGGGVAALPLEAVEMSVDPPSAPMDEREFDADWARALVAEAIRRFHVANQGDPLCAQVFGDDAGSFAQAAAQLGITPSAVKSRVFRLRQRFRKIMREEVLRTVADEEECDTELRYLCAVLDKIDGMTFTGLC
jgi:RNA polymerase sigma factor (sigma-70 family)